MCAEVTVYIGLATMAFIHDSRLGASILHLLFR